jgi:hypothetical protein
MNWTTKLAVEKLKVVRPEWDYVVLLVLVLSQRLDMVDL